MLFPPTFLGLFFNNCRFVPLIFIFCSKFLPYPVCGILFECELQWCKEAPERKAISASLPFYISLSASFFSQIAVLSLFLNLFPLLILHSISPLSVPSQVLGGACVLTLRRRTAAFFLPFLWFLFLSSFLMPYKSSILSLGNFCFSVLSQISNVKPHRSSFFSQSVEHKQRDRKRSMRFWTVANSAFSIFNNISPFPNFSNLSYLDPLSVAFFASSPFPSSHNPFSHIICTFNLLLCPLSISHTLALSSSRISILSVLFWSALFLSH